MRETKEVSHQPRLMRCKGKMMKKHLNSIKIEDLDLDGVDSTVLKIRRSHLASLDQKDLQRGKYHKTKFAQKAICNKKTRYRDRKEALEALHRIQNICYTNALEGKDWSHRKESRTYRCDQCSGYHLTSKPLHASPALRLIHGSTGQAVTAWEFSHVA
jgi:hypothetical protein